MKKTLLIFFVFLTSIFDVFSQSVEKIFETDEIKYISREPARFAPYGIYIDELNNSIEIMNGSWKGSTTFDFEGNLIVKSIAILPKTIECYQKINNLYIGSYDTNISIEKDSRFLAWVNTAESGISFILKKGSGYIVYYVDKNGIPGAVDTEGKIYTNKEAIEYLKQYDSDKYEKSLLRAEDLGLKELFEKAEVLVWGKTYYTNTYIMEKFYGKNDPYILNGLIQHDKKGYGYQLSFDYESTDLCIVNPNGKKNMFVQIDNGYKHLLKDKDSGISTSWYVGFGGNIYYYIAGKEYTEVFRIRRTWGEPDFYAMAINGYTDDEYGKYVDEVLPSLSKSDLRLLRNTIFALYGVHFKSQDLSNYFDKQVWYTDEGKTFAEVKLPEHRQKLVEKIQKLEK